MERRAIQMDANREIPADERRAIEAADRFMAGDEDAAGTRVMENTVILLWPNGGAVPERELRDLWAFACGYLERERKADALSGVPDPAAAVEALREIGDRGCVPGCRGDCSGCVARLDEARGVLDRCATHLEAACFDGCPDIAAARSLLSKLGGPDA